MVSRVETGSERCRITAVADSNIEIYATIEQIRHAGGVAAVVRSVDEVKEIMNNA